MRHRRTPILLGRATPVLLVFAGMLHAAGVAVDIAARLAPGVIYSAEIEQPVVALTIDDGPSPATGEILRVLAENDARGTFFLIGDHVERTRRRWRTSGPEATSWPTT